MNELSYGIIPFFPGGDLATLFLCGVISYITAAINGCKRQVCVICLCPIYSTLGHHCPLLLRSVENMVKVEAVAIKCNTVQLWEDLCHFNFLCPLLVKRY